MVTFSMFSPLTVIPTRDVEASILAPAQSSTTSEAAMRMEPLYTHVGSRRRLLVSSRGDLQSLVEASVSLAAMNMATRKNTYCSALKAFNGDMVFNGYLIPVAQLDRLPPR